MAPPRPDFGRCGSVGRPVKLLPLLIWLNCAYFNTFYNAKTYYEEALRQKENSPAQAQELFKKARERSALVVSRYPNSRWADDALFLVGMCYYHLGQYTQALEVYDNFEAVFPNSRFNPQVRYYIGLCELKIGDRARGLAVLSEIVQQPGPFKEDAHFQLAQAYFDLGELDEAIAYYEGFLTQYPRSRHWDEVVLSLADHYFELGDFKSAHSYLKQYIERAYTSPLKVEATLKLARCELELGDPEGAAQTARGVLDLSPIIKPQAWLLLGKALLAQDKRHEALEALSRVEGGEPGAEACYLMAKLYEEEKEFDLALAYYDSVSTRAPNSRYVSLAIRRRSLLAQLESKEDPAQAQFLLAEVYYLNLNQPEEALVEYEKVYKEYPESDYAPRALYARAWILSNVLHRDGADELYKLLIERYPDTPQASKARELLTE